MANKLFKIIACDFNVRTPTATNLEFSNLMPIVYNELELRCYNIIFNCCAYDTHIIRTLRKIMSKIKMMNETGYNEMSQFLMIKLNQYHGYKELHFYLFIYNMETANYEGVKPYLDLSINDRYAYFEYFTGLMGIYVKYMDDLKTYVDFNTPFENLLQNILNYSNNYPKQIFSWILLHCYYKTCGYIPGMNYTRWKYENLYAEDINEQFSKLPQSRWSMYNSYKYDYYENPKVKHFIKVMIAFLKLGLYKFAEVVHKNISSKLTDSENYFMSATLYILLNDSEKNFIVKTTLPIEKLPNAAQLRAHLSQINGSLEFFRGHIDSAMKNYENIVGTVDFSIAPFQLSLLRYARYSFEIGVYADAAKALGKVLICDDYSMMSNILMGKVMYKLGRLEEAITFFSESTKLKMHVPDAWAYLALINLKLKDNFKALECWKYARLNPENEISQDIIDELAKINYRDVDLYVNIPQNLKQ